MAERALNYQGIILHPMGEQHLEQTLQWMKDMELREAVDTLDEPTLEGNAAYWRARWSDTTREDYAIVIESGVHVGNCGLSNIDRQRRKAELWIYLGACRGEGVGSRAVKILLMQGFEELRLNRIYLRVLSSNRGAERFYRTLGFVFEGRWRQDSWHDGSPVDSLGFSMLGDEYRCR